MNNEKNKRPSLETTTPFGGFGARFLQNISNNFSAEKIRRTIRRFPLTIAGILTLAGFLLVQIHSRESDYVDERVWYFLPLAIVLSLAFYLAAETRLCRWFRNLLNLLLIGCWAWFSFTLTKPIADAEIIRLALLAVGFGLIIFVAAHVTDNRPMKFWDDARETLFQLVMAYFFAGVLMAGLSIALLSLDKLFGVNIPEHYYGYLATLCFVVFAPLYFLPSVPKRKVEEEDISLDVSVFIKIFGLYILLPILGIYLVILYGYLGKIIASWQLPNGWVSWLVSILGIVGYLTMFIISPLAPLPPNPLKSAPQPPEGGVLEKQSKSDSPVKRTETPPLGGWGAKFFRFFPILLFPLLILMFVGIMRRFSDYGITINRLLILLLNLWMFGVSIYIFISKSKQLKWIFISFAAIALLAAVGPWNVMSTTKRSMTSELKTLLNEANWSVTKKNDATNLKTAALSDKKQERIIDIVKYLAHNYGEKSVSAFYKAALGEKSTSADFINALGVNKQLKQEQYFSAYNDNQSYFENIDEYKIFVALRNQHNSSEIIVNEHISAKLNNNTLEISDTQNNLHFSVSLDSIIQKGLNENKNRFSVEELTITENNYKLIINSIYGEKNKENTFRINNFDAVLFLK